MAGTKPGHDENELARRMGGARTGAHEPDREIRLRLVDSLLPVYSSADDKRQSRSRPGR